MKTMRRSLLGAVTAFALLTAAACSSETDGDTDASAEPDTTEEAGEPETSGDGGDEEGSDDGGSDDAAPGTVTIEDNNGTHEIATPPQSVVVTDNRVFETLADWGIEPTAAAVSLMPDTVEFVNQADIPDIGNHREPNLELIVVADPDVVINGQRFTQYAEEIQGLAPDAVVLNLDPREGEPLDQELIRSVTVLGEIFGKQDEAAQLAADLEAAVERVQAAYDPEQTVMAVNTSGGAIGYLAPGVGRTLGPIFDLIGLTPALEVDDATDDHQGDDISEEAIAEVDPDWFLVMDRDAAVGSTDANYQPAEELLTGSARIGSLAAIQEGRVVYMPNDTYTNEGIQTYTEFLNDFADALESAG